MFPSAKTRDITYGYYHGYTLLDKEQREPAFPFGFGLSYTAFEYSDIKATDRGDAVEITLGVKNTGERDGKTVVQVYAGAPGDHPEKLLKGFKKALVKAGETLAVSVEIDKNDLKFYDPGTKTWYLEEDYTFFVGQHSADTVAVKAQ